MSTSTSIAVWAQRRADRTGCTLAQAYEIEELVAEEYEYERAYEAQEQARHADSGQGDSDDGSERVW